MSTLSSSSIWSLILAASALSRECLEDFGKRMVMSGSGGEVCLARALIGEDDGGIERVSDQCVRDLLVLSPRMLNA